MSDAVVLLAISQVVCLGGMAYLYLQFQSVVRRAPRPRHANASMVERPAVRVQEHIERQPVATPAAVRAYAANPANAGAYAANPATALASAHAVPAVAAMALANEGGVDISAIARRMNKSEEEVRLLLRRQAGRR